MKMVCHTASALSPTPPVTALKDTSATGRRTARASSSSLMEGTSCDFVFHCCNRVTEILAALLCVPVLEESVLS